MTKSTADKTIDFLLKFIPDALPKPLEIFEAIESPTAERVREQLKELDEK